ncbi:nitroreductase [Amylolactobacillus amylotrophicus DSM 20534]|uniref:Nitroreductase family protein n=3 Tax=Amylolactobacillus TaxID=2767876 RepID=A0A1L6XBB9_9LACO|nr:MULTISPECIES: nitroreductase family protein [Amylolactobacillus]APT18278.1 nitroreductase family protein [Amylolactobacillus amylophilus DSM 20533 = JCM 1125]KRK38058.1 nitroreductase [Amylolactobacillus amylotrophicus DSM 20534]KRM42318.1 nitroreductase [Amylolactobacillus amylophilus DSM 20533 = JCM 1125]GED80128.1 nitroreductase [Amylolactobacillus amylophilus]
MTTTTLDQQLVLNDFSKVMFERHSVRKFNPDKKIDREELQAMIKEATTAPSACNLQSWHFVVVDTPEGKDKAKSFMMKFNYPQLDSCAAMIFVLGDTLSYQSYRDVWNKAAEEGRITPEKRDEVFKTFLPLYESATPEFLTMDATIDASMAAMQLMLVARAHGYDTNPIAGYAADKVVQTLGLDKTRYVPVVALAVGEAAETPISSARYTAAELTDFL